MWCQKKGWRKEKREKYDIYIYFYIYFIDIDIYRDYTENDNENQGTDRSYEDWDLTPLHKSLNSSVKLPTQEMLRVTTLLMETVKS